MKPSTSAEKRRNQDLMQLLPSREFGFWTKGDLATVDRFLSNFHRPLQRRMLHISPDDSIPSTGVIQVKSTGDVYLISEPRDDTDKDCAYDRMCVLHHIGASGGLVELFSYIVDDTKDPDDSGSLTKTSIGEFYVSLEHVSSRESENSDEWFEGKSLLFTPTGTPIARNSVFTLFGKNYKVTDTFVDSSFQCAYVIELEDDMQELTYYGLADAGSGYDVATGQRTYNDRPYKFSGAVDYSRESNRGITTYTVYSKAALPFEFEIGRKLIDANGNVMYVTSVSKDANASGQFKVECLA